MLLDVIEKSGGILDTLFYFIGTFLGVVYISV